MIFTFLPHRLDVEGLVHGLHWVTMAELGGRRAGRAIVQHQGPGGNISFQSVTHLESQQLYTLKDSRVSSLKS